VFNHGAQQPCHRGERHDRVARPRLRHHRAGLPRCEFMQQPALAHAGFADHADHLLQLPGGLRGTQLGGAADHAWRTQHRGGCCGTCRRGRHGLCALYGLQQRQRLGRRPSANFILQHLFTAVERH